MATKFAEHLLASRRQFCRQGDHGNVPLRPDRAGPTAVTAKAAV